MKKLIVLAFAFVTLVAFSAFADDTGAPANNTGMDNNTTQQTETHHHAKKHEKKKMSKKAHHKHHEEAPAANTGAPANQ